MKKDTDTHRLIQNEIIARNNNRRAGKAIDALSLDIENVFFHCECSIEDCEKHIQLSLATYAKIHKKNNRFLIAPGHVSNSVEAVMERTATYWVVQKYQLDPGD